MHPVRYYFEALKLCRSAGHRSSIRRKMRSATLIAFAIVASKAGDGLPSQCARLRAARIAAAISRTRLRPSSTALS